MEVLDITFSFLNTMVPSASYGIDASLKKKNSNNNPNSWNKLSNYAV